ncbi:serine/threonine-protein kinase [Bremerella cremea]|uniref:serine/threonine-protein kinase n=1 Tax=Bremerella cremea TaxID=1031537 RepID=UPI0031F1A862
MVARSHYDDAVFERLLQDRLAPEEQHKVTQHVEHCPTCQSQLEVVADAGMPLDEVRGYLQADAGSDPTRAMEKPQSSSNIWVGFLTPSDHPDSLGRFGRYEILEVLGRGGTGIVMRGYDPSLDRHSAIKVLSPELAASAAARKRFSREAKSAAAVVHEHVVPIQTVDEENGLPYLVMPVLEGRSLESRVRKNGPLEVREVLRIGKQVASGLAAAHAQGLIHRDVKPANILLNHGVERVVITDFGLARAADDASMTQSGTLVGTPQYMSPEQARGESLDGRSDLFSLGSVLYFMCTGHSPFRADTTMGVLTRITTASPRPLTEHNPDIPDWLDQIVRKLLSRDPEERYGTALEVESLLGQWLAHLQDPTRVPRPAEPKPTNFGNGNSRITRWVAAGFGAFALMLAGILITLETGKGTLTIESFAEDVAVRIKKGDETYRRLTVTKGENNVRLAAGKYELEIEGKVDGFTLEDGEVTLTRGDEKIVRIVEKVEGVRVTDENRNQFPNIGIARDSAQFGAPNVQPQPAQVAPNARFSVPIPPSNHGYGTARFPVQDGYGSTSPQASGTTARAPQATASARFSVPNATAPAQRMGAAVGGFQPAQATSPATPSPYYVQPPGLVGPATRLPATGNHWAPATGVYQQATPAPTQSAPNTNFQWPSNSMGPAPAFYPPVNPLRAAFPLYGNWQGHSDSGEQPERVVSLTLKDGTFILVMMDPRRVPGAPSANLMGDYEIDEPSATISFKSIKRFPGANGSPKWTSVAGARLEGTYQQENNSLKIKFHNVQKLPEISKGSQPVGWQLDVYSDILMQPPIAQVPANAVYGMTPPQWPLPVVNLPSSLAAGQWYGEIASGNRRGDILILMMNGGHFELRIIAGPNQTDRRRLRLLGKYEIDTNASTIAFTPSNRFPKLDGEQEWEPITDGSFSGTYSFGSSLLLLQISDVKNLPGIANNTYPITWNFTQYTPGASPFGAMTGQQAVASVMPTPPTTDPYAELSGTWVPETDPNHETPSGTINRLLIFNRRYLIEWTPKSEDNPQPQIASGILTLSRGEDVIEFHAATLDFDRSVETLNPAHRVSGTYRLDGGHLSLTLTKAFEKPSEPSVAFVPDELPATFEFQRSGPVSKIELPGLLLESRKEDATGNQAYDASPEDRKWLEEHIKFELFDAAYDPRLSNFHCAMITNVSDQPLRDVKVQFEIDPKLNILDHSVPADVPLKNVLIQNFDLIKPNQKIRVGVNLSDVKPKETYHSQISVTIDGHTLTVQLYDRSTPKKNVSSKGPQPSTKLRTNGVVTQLELTPVERHLQGNWALQGMQLEINGNQFVLSGDEGISAEKQVTGTLRVLKEPVLNFGDNRFHTITFLQPIENSNRITALMSGSIELAAGQLHLVPHYTVAPDFVGLWGNVRYTFDRLNENSADTDLPLHPLAEVLSLQGHWDASVPNDGKKNDTKYTFELARDRYTWIRLDESTGKTTRLSGTLEVAQPVNNSQPQLTFQRFKPDAQATVAPGHIPTNVPGIIGTEEKLFTAKVQPDGDRFTIAIEKVFVDDSFCMELPPTLHLERAAATSTAPQTDSLLDPAPSLSQQQVPNDVWDGFAAQGASYVQPTAANSLNAISPSLEKLRGEWIQPEAFGQLGMGGVRLKLDGDRFQLIRDNRDNGTRHQLNGTVEAGEGIDGEPNTLHFATNIRVTPSQSPKRGTWLDPGNPNLQWEAERAFSGTYQLEGDKLNLQITEGPNAPEFLGEIPATWVLARPPASGK